MGFNKRLYHTIRLCFIRSGIKRAQYVKKKNIYNYIGENVMIMPRKVPLYPQLIRLHNNVRIASNVTFITHDNIHYMLNRKYNSKEFTENIGCIEIMDNVFIGSSSQIMYNVRIGPNAIVASGSIVTKDVPENSIVAGVPAKVIGTLDEYVKQKLSNVNNYPKELSPVRLQIKEDLVNLQWDKFERTRYNVEDY